MATAARDDLQRLAAQPLAAMAVLRLVADERASAADLGQVVETDPALSARVLRLANAPYYGLSGRIGSVGRAVVMLGFETVRAVAVSAACGLLDEHARLGPDAYWAHSVAAAVCSSIVAGEIGTSQADAFSVGLLHDVGSRLLFIRDEEKYLGVMSRVAMGAVTLTQAEREAFGVTHAECGAAALAEWRLPSAMCAAVAGHHLHPAEAHDTLTRIVIAGGSLASSLEGLPGGESHAPINEALAALELPPKKAQTFLTRASKEVDQLARFLEP